VLCCDAVGFAKPDPRAYRHACERLEVPRDRVLHVGDRYDLDFVAARAAGLDAVHLDRDDRGPHDQPKRIVSLADLRRFLDRSEATLNSTATVVRSDGPALESSELPVRSPVPG